MTEKMANDTQGDTRSLQDRMPRNAEGNLVCAGGCGRLARFGWVFKLGAITLRRADARVAGLIGGPGGGRACGSCRRPPRS